MIQVELKTDDSTLYNILIPTPMAEDNLTPEAALEGAVEFVKQTIAQGKTFLHQDEAFYLGDASKIRHIKAFYVGSQAEDEAPQSAANTNPSNPNSIGPHEFKETIHYLGNDLEVWGLRYEYVENPEDDQHYHIFMPLTINDNPALDVLNQIGLIDVTNTAANTGTYIYTQIMIPPAPMNFKSAVEYVEGYLNELRKEQDQTRELPPGRKTAKAFKGWKELP